jgi:[acyl-carrier-protein] S-malonyltransferase
VAQVHGRPTTRDGAAPTVVNVAAFNSPEQVVLSGHTAGVDAAVATLRAAYPGKFRKTVALPVSAPFHCTLMQPVTGVLAEHLASWRAQSAQLRVPLRSTVWEGLRREMRLPEVAQALVDGVVAPVHWWPTVAAMTAPVGSGGHPAVDSLLELGTGTTLTKLSGRALVAHPWSPHSSDSQWSERSPLRGTARAVGSVGDVAALVKAWEAL